MLQEKERRHKETLQKIQMQGVERMNKLKEGAKAYKEINQSKPLYQKFQENFESKVELEELAKQKKVLEDKRNFKNPVPAGGFLKAFGELEVKYKLEREKRDEVIAEKREKEKNELKNHYGSLKFKPKKAAEFLSNEKSLNLQTPLAVSVDASSAAGKDGPISIRGNSDQVASPGGILQNKFLD